jgi:hypothetical protein
MTTQEAVKRNEKAQGLKAWQVDDAWFYVESEDGKIAYKCCVSDQGDYCSCGDFASRAKNDPQFKCKHILAVMNSIPKNDIQETQFMEKRKPKLDERFIKQVDGKDFVLYAGLLDLAHQKNLVSMDVELLQYPSKENDHTAVCKAIAKTMTGGPFIDVGDANPINCNSKVAKHIIRMASTRAKARALRDLTNIGMTALEELGDFSEVIGAENEMGKAVQPRKENVKKFPAKQAQPGNGDGRKSANENPIPDQGRDETAVQTDPPVLPPKEAPAEKAEAQRADAKPERAPKVPAKAGQPVKSGNGNGKAKTDKIPMMSEAQKSAIYNLSRRRGISVEELENLAQKSFSMPVESLSHENAISFIRTLQQAA